MKKILIVLAIIFAINLGCKKMNADDDRLCGCSPVSPPALNLVIKNAAGDDLLNVNSAGTVRNEKIEFYRVTADGKNTSIPFSIQPPFSYGDEKYNYNFLYVHATAYATASADNIIWMKLGADKLYKLKISINFQNNEVETVLINDKEIPKDNSNVAKFLPIFPMTI